MSVTRVVATAPSDRARGIAASLAMATHARMPLALASAQAASTSRPADALPPRPGQDAAVEENGDPVGACRAHHADRRTVEDGHERGGRRVPDRLGQRGGGALRTPGRGRRPSRGRPGR